jgi:hypothetical protein
LPSWAPSLALPRVPFEKASFARLFSFIPYLGQSSWINMDKLSYWNIWMPVIAGVHGTAPIHM